MRKLGLVLVALIAALHLYIAWFEMFAWTSRGPKVFDTLPPELFDQTIKLAANQGIYNAFLAAGLIWSLFIKEHQWQFNVAICFLVFVAIAGVVASITVEIGTGLPQFVPATFALALLVASKGSGGTNLPGRAEP